jgi:transcriptional regulator with PAS, ATPase and Fis domain
MSPAPALPTILVADDDPVIRGNLGLLRSEGYRVVRDGPRRGAGQPTRRGAGGPLALEEILAETERRVILHALEQEGWNRTRAARVLGISRRQLVDKIQQHGLHE